MTKKNPKQTNDLLDWMSRRNSLSYTLVLYTLVFAPQQGKKSRPLSLNYKDLMNAQIQKILEILESRKRCRFMIIRIMLLSFCSILDLC